MLINNVNKLYNVNKPNNNVNKLDSDMILLLDLHWILKYNIWIEFGFEKHKSLHLWKRHKVNV